MKKIITFRERQVLQCLAGGLTSRETAQQLCLSMDTIKTYRSRLLLKLDAKNAFQLGMNAIKYGFLDTRNQQATLKIV